MSRGRFIRREDWTFGASPHNPEWQRWFIRDGWSLCPGSHYKQNSELPVIRETARGSFVMICEDGQVYHLDSEMSVIEAYPSRSIVTGKANAESIAHEFGGWL